MSMLMENKIFSFWKDILAIKQNHWHITTTTTTMMIIEIERPRHQLRDRERKKVQTPNILAIIINSSLTVLQQYTDTHPQRRLYYNGIIKMWIINGMVDIYWSWKWAHQMDTFLVWVRVFFLIFCSSVGCWLKSTGILFTPHKTIKKKYGSTINNIIKQHFDDQGSKIKCWRKINKNKE